MNFSQMHERLRAELLHRIQRGTLSVSLLARQTGFGQSHISNFLHNRGQLSIDAMDRMLAAQHLLADDLLPDRHEKPDSSSEKSSDIPVVSHHAALFEPYIRPASLQWILHLPADALSSMRTRGTPDRRTWQRFVAVRVPPADALPMEPLIFPEAIAVIDRHYNTLRPYRPNRPSLFAVRNEAHLALRYVDFTARRLVLRPHNIAFPVALIEVALGTSPSLSIVGRVVFILNET